MEGHADAHAVRGKGIGVARGNGEGGAGSREKFGLKNGY